MRKIIIFFVLLFLVGCTSVESDFNNMFKDSLSKIDNIEIPKSNNHNKGLFSYYLPKNIGVLQSNNISSVLTSDNAKIFMSVNVSTVMDANNDDDIVIDEKDFELVSKFKLKGRKEEKEGSIIIENLSNNQYLFYLSVDDVFFLSSVSKAKLPTIMDDVLYIARSLDVKKNDIVAEFSNKETFSYEKEIIELFSESIPEDGMIKEIIIEEAGD